MVPEQEKIGTSFEVPMADADFLEVMLQYKGDLASSQRTVKPLPLYDRSGRRAPEFEFGYGGRPDLSQLKAIVERNVSDASLHDPLVQAILAVEDQFLAVHPISDARIVRLNADNGWSIPAGAISELYPHDTVGYHCSIIQNGDGYDILLSSVEGDGMPRTGKKEVILRSVNIQE